MVCGFRACVCQMKTPAATAATTAANTAILRICWQCTIRKRGIRRHCFFSTMPEVITRGIREFVSRDWAAARQSKERYWAERVARLGPLEAWRVAEELRRQALVQDHQWPGAERRRRDLLDHVRLARLFRRVDPTRRA